MSKKSKVVTSQADNSPPLQSNEHDLDAAIDSSALDLLWKHLNEEDCQRLSDSDSFEQIESYMAERFELTKYEIDMYQAVFLDYYVTHYFWASRQAQFNNDQVSIYFSIVFALLNNLKEKSMSLGENIIEFRGFLAELESGQLFSSEQISDIIENINLTFFQNYKAYTYFFENPLDEIIISKEVELEVPKPRELHFPPPLDEAMPIEMYNKYVLKLKDEPEETSGEDHSTEKLEEAIKLPEDVIEQINKKFEGLSLIDAKKIIFQVTEELLVNFKNDMRNKLKEKEHSLIAIMEETNAATNKPRK